MPTQPEGLRERKKRETRAALSDAAIRLAVAHGLKDLRIEQIAKEANVSPRTFNNYFSSKEEAIAGGREDRTDIIREALMARPRNEPLWTALGHAVCALFPEQPDREWMKRAVMVRSEPSLLAARTKSDQVIEGLVAEMIAEHTGSDPRSGHPRLAAAVTTVTLHAAVDRWLEAGKKLTLHAAIAEAFGQVGAGLPPVLPKKK